MTKEIFLIFCFLFLCSSKGDFLKKNSTINNRPIVGILTQPSEYKEYPGSNYSYIPTAYIEFVEASGARVLPIKYNLPNETLHEIFNGINGLLIPGMQKRK